MDVKHQKIGPVVAYPKASSFVVLILSPAGCTVEVRLS
jgi:hypothetical protein